MSSSRHYSREPGSHGGPSRKQGLRLDCRLIKSDFDYVVLLQVFSNSRSTFRFKPGRQKWMIDRLDR